ncbi:MAG: hypothetical protein II835_03825 [Fibrobacter sp.]|nr:hypothetical protein [Fibrobacter sp.]
MTIIPYSINRKETWDAFVEMSKNGTFLLKRNFMDYHSDRFFDCSLLIYSGISPDGEFKEKGLTTKDLVAVFPANWDKEHLTVYSEVMQDSLVDLIECGKVDAASSTAITMSKEKMKAFFEKLDALKGKIVLRPMEISNSPEVIRRLNVIAINTIIEADLYGNTNSSYVGGSRLMNGVGGSGDFCQNGGLSIFITKSTAKNGTISSIVPLVSHIDHTSKTVQVIVTEQGVADLRGLNVIERAHAIIDNCAHPKFRPALEKYLRKASVLSDYPAYPYSVEAAQMFHGSV